MPRPPPLMTSTSHTEPISSRVGKGGPRGRNGSAGDLAISNSRGVAGANDFSQLPSSPEHNMGLKAHAAEFVPGGGGASGGGSGSGGGGGGGGQRKGKKGQQTLGGRGGAAAAAAAAAAAIKGAAPGSDLTAFAREFVPGGGGGDENQDSNAASLGGNGHGGSSAAAVSSGPGGGPGVGAAAAEKMVQVVRGGTIYFVPESEALATDELVGAEAYGPEEDGFAWAHGSAALAAPQRRTMHRLGVYHVSCLHLRACGSSIFSMFAVGCFILLVFFERTCNIVYGSTRMVTGGRGTDEVPRVLQVSWDRDRGIFLRPTHAFT